MGKERVKKEHCTRLEKQILSKFNLFSIFNQKHKLKSFRGLKLEVR